MFLKKNYPVLREVGLPKKVFDVTFKKGEFPDSFEEIIALVALFRPGPLQLADDFIRRKHGLDEVDYLHPSLQEVLKDTYGVMLYQEQVMQIAQVMSGFSLGEADLLRRAMGKKIKAEMQAQKFHSFGLKI